MRRTLLAIIAILLSSTPAWGIDVLSGFGVRIKDIALVEGARPNQLRGLGLVTGLNRTGDNSETSIASEMMRGAIRSLGLVPTEDIDKLSLNNAAVMIYAEIPPFAKPGTKLDVQVTAIGGAKSLQGGFLAQTPLKGADGQVYAVAQGSLTTGAFQFGGKGAKVQRGLSTTVAMISQGAIVEEEIPVTLLRNQYLYLDLKNPDFTTATRMADAIGAMALFQKSLLREPAAAIDAATVRVEVPEKYQEEVELVRLIAEVGNVYVEPDTVAKIIVNERSGTIVIGEHVRISTVVIAHSGLNVAIIENPEVSQPQPFGGGQTQVTNRTDVQAEGEPPRTHLLKGGVPVGQLVDALNALGASLTDIVAILQAIKAQGALHAELVVQ